MTQSLLLQQIIASVPADFADPGADCVRVRETMAPFHSQPVSPEVRIAIETHGGVRCGRYRLGTDEPRLMAFHCHGGAFVSCPLDHYHFYAEMIARQTGAEVFMPDYRLAPEHVFPAAHDDCFHAYQGLLASGCDPRRIVLMGESCGGSLALGLMVRARDAGLPLPACFVSLTGWFDLSLAGPEPTGNDPFLTPSWVRNRGRDYTAGRIPLADPRLSPAHAALAGLPPCYLQLAEHDTVREGVLTLATRAARAGVAVTLEAWPGLIHGWHGLANAGVPEALAAWSRIRTFMEGAVA
ncbi:MAG: alpha/beta hydrolase [Proteobacteria bacterium]|nr:alpha/beta hydrolase [Pseudomonadota bacterium]HQR04774.1 alpha/beta hydrolase [Rhodocyclaceae bacterium]